MSSPYINAINELKVSIQDYKKDFPTTVEPEYINQFLNAFNSYLKSLDLLNLEVAIEIIKIGKANAKATLDSIENQDVASILFYSHFLLPTVIDTKSEIGKKISVFVSPREPERFSNNPYQDSNVTKISRKTWHTNVHLNSHLIAERYIKRRGRIFTKDEVLSKYGELFDSGMKRQNAFESMFEWVESYEVSKDALYGQIGIQLQDLESFHREYKRWLSR